MHVYSLPLRTRFRGIDVREGLLVQGAAVLTLKVELVGERSEGHTRDVAFLPLAGLHQAVCRCDDLRVIKRMTGSLLERLEEELGRSAASCVAEHLGHLRGYDSGQAVGSLMRVAVVAQALGVPLESCVPP